METEKPDYWVDVDIILGLYTYFARKKHREIKWIGWEHFNFFYNFMYYKTLRKIARKIVCKKADALVVLSEEDREIILLRYVNEVPVNVIAKLYSMSRFALNRRINSILRRLHEYLGREELI